jgi:hypothetical protein
MHTHKIRQVGQVGGYHTYHHDMLKNGYDRQDTAPRASQTLASPSFTTRCSIFFAETRVGSHPPAV